MSRLGPSFRYHPTPCEDRSHAMSTVHPIRARMRSVHSRETAFGLTPQPRGVELPHSAKRPHPDASLLAETYIAASRFVSHPGGGSTALLALSMWQLHQPYGIGVPGARKNQPWPTNGPPVVRVGSLGRHWRTRHERDFVRLAELPALGVNAGRQQF